MEATTSIAIADLINLSQGLASTNLGYLEVAVAIIAIIIALLGTAFYVFNFKPLKDLLDKQEDAIKDLKKEVKDSFDKAEGSLNKTTAEFKDSYSKEISTTLESREEKLLSDVKSQIAILDKNLSQKIEDVTKIKDDNLKTVVLSEIGSQLRALEKSLIANVAEYKESNIKELSTLKSDLDSGLRELKMKVKELEAFKYHTEGKMGGILYLMDVLEDYIKYKPHLLEFRLEEIKERIGQYSLTKERSDRLKAILNKIKGKEYDKIIAEIESAIVLEEEKK